MLKVFTPLSTLVRNLRTIVSDGLRFFVGVWRRRAALAENLFLRKQLAMFREREKKAMPTTPVGLTIINAPRQSNQRASFENTTCRSHFDRLASQCIPVWPKYRNGLLFHVLARAARTQKT